MKDKISSEDFIKSFGNGVKDNREMTLNTESGDCISREALKEDLFIKFGNQLPNGLLEEIDKAPTVERPQLSDEQIDKITDLLENEWGYEGMREDVSRILKGGTE